MDTDTNALYESFMVNVNEANEDYINYKRNIEVSKLKNQIQSLNQNIYNVSKNPGAFTNAKSYIDNFNKQRDELVARLAQLDPASANAFAGDKAIQAGAMKTKLDDISQTDKAIAQAATGSVAGKPETAQASTTTQEPAPVAAPAEQPATTPGTNTTMPAPSETPAEVMNYDLNPPVKQQPVTTPTEQPVVTVPSSVPGVSFRGAAPTLRPGEPVPAQASTQTQNMPTFKNWIGGRGLRNQPRPSWASK